MSRKGSGGSQTSDQIAINTTGPLSSHLNLRSPQVLQNDLLLHEAVIKNETEAARNILLHPVDVNSRNNYGRAPIHWAASHGNSAIVQMLLSANCDLEAKDKNGMTPLHMATWHGHTEVVQQLINAGADTQMTTKKGFGLLSCASRNNRLSVLTLILDTLTETIDINATDLEGQTALFHAAANGHVDVVLKLLEREASHEISNKELRSPVHAACEKGHVEVADALLKKDPSTVNVQDGDGNSPLHIAVYHKQNSIVKLLLEKDVLVDASNLKGSTPLHIACGLGCQGILEALLQHGSSIDVKNKNGDTPLHCACRTNQIDAVITLIRNGANINDLNEGLQSPIHIAAENGHTEICKLLLDGGANLQQKEIEGRTPLYIAARGSFTAIVDMIIRTTRIIQSSSEDNIVAPERTDDQPSKTISQLEEQRQKDYQHIREVLWKLSHKQLEPEEWKKLATLWKFTDEQINAIENQYTGPCSYKEHGFRMLLIWQHGLPSNKHPMTELYHSLVQIDKRNIAESLHGTVTETHEKRDLRKRLCITCSLL